jgi:hypothetical protein
LYSLLSVIKLKFAIMDTLNIGGNERDRFYRYKMPKLISKVKQLGLIFYIKFLFNNLLVW